MRYHTTRGSVTNSKGRTEQRLKQQQTAFEMDDWHPSPIIRNGQHVRETWEYWPAIVGDR